MQTVLEADGTLRLDFESLSEAESFFAGASEQHGFFLQLPRALKPLQRVTVRASAPPAFQTELDADVVQLFPGGGGCGTAFQLVDWNEKKDDELARRLKGREESESELSPMFKIKKMNPTERFRLASRASRIERQILIRDNSPQVLMGLLNHPQVETKEVLEIIKSNFSTGGIMERVIKNHKWMQNAEIQLAIVRSPKTPPPLAIKLLSGLRTNDLRMMAKSTAIRESLRKAALRTYLKRTGKKA